MIHALQLSFMLRAQTASPLYMLLRHAPHVLFLVSSVSTTDPHLFARANIPTAFPSNTFQRKHKAELARANEIFRRTFLILTAAYDAGSHISIENPADRSDSASPLFMHLDHGSLSLAYLLVRRIRSSRRDTPRYIRSMRARI